MHVMRKLTWWASVFIGPHVSAGSDVWLRHRWDRGVHALNHPFGSQAQPQDEAAVRKWRVSLDTSRLKIAGDLLHIISLTRPYSAAFRRLLLCFPLVHPTFINSLPRCKALMLTWLLCRSRWSIKTTWEPRSHCVFTPSSFQCNTARTSAWRRSDATWWRRWWRLSFLPSTWMTRPSTICCQVGNS